MRLLRLLLVTMTACALAVTAALAQTPAPQTVPLPGGGKLTVNLPAPKPKKGKKGTRKRTSVTKRTATVQLGIADQKADMFTDPRFLGLGLKTARRSVAWDTFQYDWQIADIEDWLNKARAAGVRPLITFARSRIQSKIHQVPTRAQWLAGFKAFRQRFPWVTDFVASNESNHTPPTQKFPKLAAQYYNDMRRACPTCRVAAATINEQNSKTFMEVWIRKFIKAAGHRPKYWALHNYYGANTKKTSYTKRVLKATKTGQIWVTEVGGLVKRRTGNFAGKLKMPEGQSHATQTTRFIFDRMLTLSPRITKVYLYHWSSSSLTDTWDSALIGPDGKARGGLAIIESRLKKQNENRQGNSPGNRPSTTPGNTQGNRPAS